MAERRTDSGQAVTAAVAMLLQAAAGDTTCRDLYLRRARERMERTLPEDEYRALADGRLRVEQWMEKSRAAVARGDWAEVQALSAKAAALQAALVAQAAALEVAEAVYDAAPVAFDPYSRGLETLARKDGDARRARAETIAALEAVGAADASLRGFCAARREALSAIVLPEPVMVERSGTPTSVGATPEQQALAAAQRGDAETLRRLAEQMLSAKPAGAAPAQEKVRSAIVPASLVVPPVLGQPIPSAAAAASALGLEAVTARPSAPQIAEAIREFLVHHAGGASAAAHERARDGIEQLGASIREELPRLELPDLAGVHVETLIENLSLFALHLYVNSAGVRYVPLPVAEEPVLVEGHEEGDESPSPLLAELGLESRRGLARDEIEGALLRHGERVLASLGLDPLEFRLLCIPQDLFVRIGGARGWGRRREWTHLDGYQVLRGGRLRALVGGSSEFGGLADLCAISPADARQNVFVRFAVVRRARLSVRLG